MNGRLIPLLASVVVALVGCEGVVDGTGTRGLPVSASPPRGCDVPAVLPPGGILAVDTSMTPRANAMAETLAMEASGELVAPEALYQRVDRELRAITGSSGTAFTSIGCGVTAELLVGMTAAGIEQVENGQYTAWNDYNAVLRLTERVPKLYGYQLVFDGVYNHAALGQAYAELAEVQWAGPNGFTGKSSDACLEAFGDALDTHVYIFRSGSGDCQAGCIDNTYHGYAADQTGAVVYLGSYDTRGATVPDWFTKARQCRNFL